MLSETWDRWLRAYCLIRDFPPLQPVAEGYYLEVAKRQQSGRFFVSTFDDTTLRRLLSHISEPTTYVELPAPREMLVDLLPEDWRFGEATYLMGCDLQTVPTRQNLGLEYAICVEHLDGLVNLRIRSSEGEQISSGTCLLIGGTAIFDQVSTEMQYRRLGLGPEVIVGLATEAKKAGAKSGLLVATPAGRCLYEALGWGVLSEVSTMVSPRCLDDFVYRIDQGAYDGRFVQLPAAA